MKPIIATTALLALTTGFAAAEVTLSGDARMGIIGDGDNVYFTHRVRAKFTLSGESDSGFSFGASFRPSNAYEAAGLGKGSAGEVFISGAFGTLTMGDIDNAAQAVVGQVDGVGFTGLGDWQEIRYLGDASTSARYDYASGGLSLSASVGQNGSDGYSVAAAYAMDGYKFSVGYESDPTYINTSLDEWLIEDHVILGADATVGAVTLKARYSMGNGIEPFWNDAVDLTQYALSATYSMDALSLTAYVASFELSDDDGDFSIAERYGIGASYDLGGGASLKAGYALSEGSACDRCIVPLTGSNDSWDLGLSFEF